MKLTDEQELILKNVYYDISQAGAYSGPIKLHHVLKRKGHNISIPKITQWLSNQDNYSLQRPVRRKIKRPKVVVSGQFEQYDADLADVSNISSHNKSVRYLLFVIDVFSRFVWVSPLIDKKSTTVLGGLKLIFSKAPIPIKLRTDGGREFCNRLVDNYLKAQSIYHHVTLNETKTNYAERVIQTIKNMLYRYFTKQRTYRYIDVLQKIVNTYNSSPHSSLNNVAPINVNVNNEANLWAYMYLKKSNKIKTSSIGQFKYNIGDMIRISHLKGHFQRSYEEQWSTEIFKIKSKFLMQGIPMYKLIDFSDDPVTGNFYEAELQKVEKSEDSLWIIERKIKKRKRGRKIEWFVKFDGWGDKYNMWLPEDSITNI